MLKLTHPDMYKSSGVGNMYSLQQRPTAGLVLSALCLKAAEEGKSASVVCEVCGKISHSRR